jgi:uncharacterized protein DUF2505
MKLKESFSYPGTDVESVYALTSDPDFRKESAIHGQATEVDVTVEPNGEGHIVTIVRTQPANLPDFVKKFVGDSVMVKVTERWGGPDADGTRVADLKVNIIGQPAEMIGNATLSAASDPVLTVEGDVKVNVPFIGKKMEPEIAKAIIAGVRIDVELGNERL